MKTRTLKTFIFALVVSAKFVSPSVSTALELVAEPFVIVELILFIILCGKGFNEVGRNS